MGIKVIETKKFMLVYSLWPIGIHTKFGISTSNLMLIYRGQTNKLLDINTDFHYKVYYSVFTLGNLPDF